MSQTRLDSIVSWYKSESHPIKTVTVQAPETRLHADLSMHQERFSRADHHFAVIYYCGPFFEVCDSTSSHLSDSVMSPFQIIRAPNFATTRTVIGTGWKKSGRFFVFWKSGFSGISVFFFAWDGMTSCSRKFKHSIISISLMMPQL